MTKKAAFLIVVVITVLDAIAAVTQRGRGFLENEPHFHGIAKKVGLRIKFLTSPQFFGR